LILLKFGMLNHFTFRLAENWWNRWINLGVQVLAEKRRCMNSR